MALTRRGFLGSLAAAAAALKAKRPPPDGSFTGIKAEGKPVVASQYAPVTAGSYAPGANFNIGSRQTITSNSAAYYEVSNPENGQHWIF